MSKMSMLVEHLTCRIHLHFYSEPKRMPQCPHVFCQTCIDKLDESQIGQIQCPLCGKEQTLPPGGTADLITDSTLEQMVKNFTCKCGNVSANAKHCDDCDVNYCSDCTEEHGDPLKCNIVTNTEKLEKIMTNDFKKSLSGVLTKNKAAAQKIQTMKKEVAILHEFIVHRLNRMKIQFMHELPDPQDFEDKSETLKELVLNSGLIEYSKTVLSYKSRPESMTSHSENLKRVVDIATRKDLLDDPVTASHADDILEQFLTLCGWLSDYQDRRVASVVELPPGKPTGVAWHPLGNKVCISAGCSVQYIRPCSTSYQFISSRWRDHIITSVHVTALGELLLSDGKTVLIYGGNSIPVPTTSQCVALTSFDEGSTRTVYVLTEQQVYYTKLNAGHFDQIETFALDSQLQNATDITTDRHGQIYICDTEHEAVLVFDREGNLVNEILESRPRILLTTPTGVCVDPYDNLLVSDGAHHSVHIYDKFFKYLTTLMDEILQTPGKVAVDRLKRVFVVDKNKNHVVVFHHSWISDN